jgi:hypothetical protein
LVVLYIYIYIYMNTVNLSSKSSSWCFGRTINYNLISIISPSGKQKEANPSLVVLYNTNIVMSTCMYVHLFYSVSSFIYSALTYFVAAYLLVFIQKYVHTHTRTYAYLYVGWTCMVFFLLDRSIFPSYITVVYTIYNTVLKIINGDQIKPYIKNLKL